MSSFSIDQKSHCTDVLLMAECVAYKPVSSANITVSVDTSTELVFADQ